jgi:hypothetical protein
MKHSLALILFLFVGSLVFPLVSNAQIVPDSTSKWKKKLVFNLNLNQAAFSSNWKGGGVPIPSGLIPSLIIKPITKTRTNRGITKSGSPMAL